MTDAANRRWLAVELEAFAKKARESAISGGMASLGRQMLAADSVTLSNAAKRLEESNGTDPEQVISQMTIFSLSHRDHVREAAEMIGVMARPGATHSGEIIAIARYRK